MKKILFLQLFILLLSGCASVPDKNLQLKNVPLDENEGLVIAEVINNSERIAGIIRNWEELILFKTDEPDNTKNVISISALSNPSSSFLFAGRLKSGVYRLGLLYTFQKLGDTSYSARALIPPGMGEFEVIPGEITNLGTILYHPFEQIHHMEKQLPDYAVTRFENTELTEFIAKQHPEIFKYIDTTDINSWNEDDLSGDRNDAFELIKSSSVLEYYFPLSNGEFVATGKLGSMFLFLGDGKGYKNLSVPTRREISAFTETPEKQWIIGGEYGLLKKSSPPYKEWIDIQLNDNLNHILDIKSNKNGDVFILSFDGIKYNVYELNKAFTTKLLRSFGQKQAFFFDGGFRPQIKLNEEYLKVLNEKIAYSHSLNDANDWTSEEVTELAKIYYQRNGLQLTSKTSSWSGLGPLLYSKDGGNSWSRVSRDEEVSGFIRPFIFTDGKILLLREMDDIKLFRKTNIYEKVEVKLSDDEGMTWKNRTSLPKSCNSFMHNVSDDSNVYVRCSNGGIHVTNDRGQSWKEVLWNHQIPMDKFPKSFVIPLSKLRNPK